MKYKPRWEGFLTLVDALIFMLKKPGYNLPLVKSGAPFPPPSTLTPTKQPRLEFPSPSQISDGATSRLAASPVKRTFGAPSRAGSPVKATAGQSPAPAGGRSLATAFRDVDELTAGKSQAPSS